MWEDILPVCRLAQTALNPSQPQINVEHFSLFEAMNAAEMMDPKMDLGFGLGENENYYSESIQIGHGGAANYDDLFNILQKIFILEVGFIDGASLLESTHLCKYLWIEEYEKKSARRDLGADCGSILDMYCFSLKKGLEQYVEAVLACNIFEEEDFQSAHRHILGTGDAMEAEVQAGTEAVYDCLRDNKTDPNKAKAVLFMQYRQRIYQFMFSVHRWCKELMDINTKYNRTSNKCDISAIKVEIFSALLHEMCPIASTNITLLEVITGIFKADASNASSAPSSSSSSSSVERNLSFDMVPEKGSSRNDAFSSIRSKMLTTGPLRAIKFKSAVQSAEQMTKIVVEVSAICAMIRRFIQSFTTDSPNNIDYPSLVRELLLMSSQRYHLLSRSLAFTVLRVMMMDTPIILRSCLQKTPLTASELDYIFGDPVILKHLCGVCVSTVDTLCIHRNKILGKIDSLKESWFALVEATIDDTVGAEQPTFFHWLVYCLSMVMEIHAQLTFESNLLYKKEIPFIYWYWYYALSCQLYAIERMKSMKKEQSLEIEEHYIKGKRWLLQGLFESCHIYRSIDNSLDGNYVAKDDNNFFISPKLFFRQRLHNFTIFSDSFHLSLDLFENKIFNNAKFIASDKSTVAGIAKGAGALYGQARTAFDTVRKAIIVANNNEPIESGTKNALLHNDCVSSLKVCIALSVNNISTVKALSQVEDGLGDLSYTFDKYDDCTHILKLKK